MASLLNVSNVLLHNLKTTNLEILFAQEFNIDKANHNLINKFVIHRFNQYKALNAKDRSL